MLFGRLSLWRIGEQHIRWWKQMMAERTIRVLGRRNWNVGQFHFFKGKSLLLMQYSSSESLVTECVGYCVWYIGRR